MRFPQTHHRSPSGVFPRAAGAFVGLLVAVGVALSAQSLPGLRNDLYAAWMRDGMAREQAGAWQAAAICYRRALEYRPQDPGATWRLAQCLARAGEAGGAAKLLRELLARAPGHPEASLLLARLLLNKGKAAEAAGVLEAALKMRPLDERLLVETGRAWLAAGRAEKALPHLRKVETSGSAEASFLLGRCYLALNRPDAAEGPLRAAVAAGAGLPAAVALAEACLLQKRWLEVVALVQPLTASNPKNWRAWWLLGEGYLGLADVAGASEALSKAALAAPPQQKRTAWLKAAKMALGAGLPEIVLQIAPAAPRPLDAEVLSLQARAAEGLSRWQEAAAAWEQAAANKPALLGNAARCWLQAGNQARALRCLDRLGATDPAALQEAARLALASGQPAAAQKYLRQLLALRPDAAELHFALAELLSRTGQLAVAARQAHEAPSRDADTWRLLAKLYEAADMPQAAAAAALRAWRASRKLSEAECAAQLLRRCGRWSDLADLLGEVNNFSETLRMEIAHLALHENRPADALKALGSSGGAQGEALRAEAHLHAGQAPEALAALARAWDAQGADRPALARLLRRVPFDGDTRNQALELATKWALRPDCPQDLADTLAQLLTAEFGEAQMARRMAAIARLPKASFALTQAAVQSLVKVRAATEALSLIAAKLQSAKDADTRAQLLALAARACLAAGDVPGAADYLARAAAIKNHPAVLARLTLIEHSSKADQRLTVALDSLARAWAEGTSDAQALADFMHAACTEPELLAWARQYTGARAEVALVKAQAALATGNVTLALSQLRDAPQTRPVRRLYVHGLLSAGRAPEAEVLVADLLRGDLEATDCALAGDVAAAGDDWANAAWWYGFALARSDADKSSDLAAKLSTAADRAELDVTARRWLAEAATETAPAPDREGAVARLRQALTLPEGPGP